MNTELTPFLKWAIMSEYWTCLVTPIIERARASKEIIILWFSFLHWHNWMIKWYSLMSPGPYHRLQAASLLSCRKLLFFFFYISIISISASGLRSSYFHDKALPHNLLWPRSLLIESICLILALKMLQFHRILPQRIVLDFCRRNFSF